jgi:hypothetical protein
MRGIVDTARNGAVLKTLSDNNQARLRITSLVLGGLGGCLCLTACSQAIDYTYSKRDFTTPKFEADLAACRHQNASASAFQATTSNQRAQLDEAAMRDCMAAKGYKVDIAPR